MVGMWKLDPFKAKWTERFSSIMLDWGMGGMLHVSGWDSRKSENGVRE
jgi:hypothetical protein